MVITRQCLQKNVMEDTLTNPSCARLYEMLDLKGLANVFVLSFKGDAPAHTNNIDSKYCQCDLKVKT